MRQKLAVMEILPELEMGGVENHVIDLSNFLSAQGHHVMVVSAGGKLVSELHGPEHIKLPVVSKNPLSVIAASLMLAREIKNINARYFTRIRVFPDMLRGLRINLLAYRGSTVHRRVTATILAYIR